MRLIKIPDDGIIRIPIIDKERIIGYKNIDLRDMPTIELVRYCPACGAIMDSEDLED